MAILGGSNRAQSVQVKPARIAPVVQIWTAFEVLVSLPEFLTHILMSETPDQLPDKREDVDTQTVAIRTLNDQLRCRLEGGQIMMTQGVNSLADETLHRVLHAVQGFDDFTEDNDPYGTHEFGMIEVDNERVMFKIDAYDANHEYGSPDPADPEVTRRVMTILLASEY